MDINVLTCSESIDIFDSVDGSPFEADDQAHALRACLVHEYEPLRRSLASRLGCEDLATECLHETWIRLGTTSPLQPVRDPPAYVFRVAYHLAVDRMRGDRQDRHAVDAEGELQAMVDPAPGPDAIVQARADARDLEQALQQLPYRHGCVLFALRVDEKTRQEVADWLSVSVRNVDTMLRQTYETLGSWRERRTERGMLACLAREAGKEKAWRRAQRR
ncbi:extracytoplasmic-function sigma-70 factor [Bordetella ansorpii]|uniref:Extracytoplasmic-function sigma-70 factor n=1 Tax=Bordetella ansorpii TaxID=288768 RepID=A0A157QJL5_9BORD|nr:RNA polymerase sigma factor [Bordetella ansorpii]SAI46145.1 extracytoplasmic-function sigma-70 factor [Bordetella ansorpii]